MLRRFDLAKRALLVGPRRYLSSSSGAPISEAKKTVKYQVGDVHHGFAVDQVSRIEELHLDAVRLTHTSTGARYLHLERDDSNNVFSINFRTIPRDSTGLPHVLEHTVLCGSRRYPCRDPFFKMLRRSLATFMNAMTGPDFTFYPLSTQNPKDYRNLQSVYLESVFRPSLRELDFRQEGWRLEHEDPNNPESAIIIKGVVYNEMKGVFNENQAIFGEKFLNTILPSHTYSHCSGGDPLIIPEMTHEALVDFHAKHYHPSNARFYSYGNFPLDQHLNYIDENYLRDVSRIDTSHTLVPPEQRWAVPRREHVRCRCDPMAADQTRQSSIAIGQLCNDINDVQGTFELYVLSQLLLKGPNSAFYKSLVETKLGTGFGPLVGFESQIRDTMFVVSLQGVRSEDFTLIEEKYQETLKRVLAEGFAKDHIDAVLHGIELAIKHQTSNFGLNLLFNVSPLWNHDGDIVRSLRINESMRIFMDRLTNDPKYLNKLVEKYLIANNHRLTLTMSPDEDYDRRRCEAEENLLKTKLDEISNEDLGKIYQAGQDLLADQQKVEPEVLPTLKIEDLKSDVERHVTRDEIVAGVPLQISVQPTNGVAYYRAVINTRDFDDELKVLLPIFNAVVAQMGTKKHDYRSFDQLCQLRTGGLSFSNHVAETKTAIGQYEEGIIVQSYCLDKYSRDMWSLWQELFNDVTLDDVERFENLINEMAGDLNNGIADSGHVYAMSSARSLVTESSRLKERLSGLEYVTRMKNIARDKNFEFLLGKIREIGENVLHKGKMRSAINLSPENQNEIVEGMENFYKSIRGDNSASSRIITHGKVSGETGENAVHHVMPYTVNYTSKAILTVPYDDPEFAVLRVIASLISNLYLFPELREKGGAYGAGAALSTEGAFTFYTYRDPNSTRTLDIFDGSWDFLKNGRFTEKDIDEAKLGIFQRIDAPVPPGNRGLEKFLHGLTNDDLQRQRLRLKNVTRDMILETGEKFLSNEKRGSLRIGRALLGPLNPDLENRKSEGWNVLDQDVKTQARAC